MIKLLRNMHNRRPLLWTVIAFIVVALMLMTMSIWWNYLLVQNDRILRQMTQAAKRAEDFPLAVLMVLGILCSVVVLLGVVYMFLRLIKAVQLNLAQSQFIAAVTHELRSPVASLQLMLETIRDPTTPPDKRREFELCMVNDLRRLRGLVDQVLETARLENFSTTPEVEPIAVGELLRQCSESMDVRLKTTASRMQIFPFDPELRVMANARLTVLALSNILDNALKYSNGPAEINIRVHAAGPNVTIEISDLGIGLDRRELKRVFRRFYRVQSRLSHGKPGTGLGLYFARQAVRAQGGDIGVQSEGQGLGTTFLVDIPKVRGPLP